MQIYPLTPPSSFDLKANAPSLDPLDDFDLGPPLSALQALEREKGVYSAELNSEEQLERKRWLAGGRGRKGLRIMIVTENFLPKVDGVTRTLARLLEHLEAEGHECMVLGPNTGMTHYASHPLVGTLGVPLMVYPGLKLNFLRPRFLSRIHDWKPDVIHFVDPIWLGAQTIFALRRGLAGNSWCSSDDGDTALPGAIVASYHTNIATYATLFGMAWLEPIIWRWQRYFYSKALLTLCPSPSTASMLNTRRIPNVRLWPRGVDLTYLHPSKRSESLRRKWGVYVDRKAEIIHDDGMMTPPATPETLAADAREGDARSVALYVGRISWEKNLSFLLHALGFLAAHLPPKTLPPKMVFVGDGPARSDVEKLCQVKGIDAIFMGHQSGEELARCYASADVFLFPSFTETFGQVVLEALASGLPVIGLDADGTRDLVKHERTGYLLKAPSTHRSLPPNHIWPAVCRDAKNPAFLQSADAYARLIARSVAGSTERRMMSTLASTEGVVGFTWWDAMERCVDGYRESLRMTLAEHQPCVGLLDVDGVLSRFRYISSAIVVALAILLATIAVLLARR